MPAGCRAHQGRGGSSTSKAPWFMVVMNEDNRMSQIRRAMNAGQKERRRDDVLDAARRLCIGSDMSALSMDAIAREAGLAKGTLYLYFQTKEQLFLALLEQDMEGWLASVEAAFAEALPSDHRALARFIAAGLIERPLMTQLFARLPAVLEGNLPDDVALAFRLRTVRRTDAFGACLEKVLGPIARGQGARLSQWVFAMIVGVHQIANPRPRMQRVLESTPELRARRLDFESELADALTALLDGIAPPA